MLAIVFWGSNKHWQKCRSRIQKEDSWGFDGVFTYLRIQLFGGLVYVQI
jgi:hypothetical protein